MRFAILALLLSLSCRPIRPFELPGIPLDTDPSIQLTLPSGQFGHACPVETTIVTAAHVMWDEERKTFSPAAAWSSGTLSGFAFLVDQHPAMDIVRLAITDPPPGLPAGYTVPGDTVYWFEYDFRTQENVMRGRRRFASVLRIVAQHIYFDGAVSPGASGSCLLNDQGQVVGIVIASFATDDTKTSGIAVVLPDEVR